MKIKVVKQTWVTLSKEEVFEAIAEYLKTSNIDLPDDAVFFWDLSNINQIEELDISFKED